MSVFAYSLAKYRPELYQVCLYPSPTPIPISYEGRHLCDSTITEAAVIEMDVPDEVIRKIETGRMIVVIHNTSLSPEREADPQTRFRIVEIEMYDRD
ncbi:MAG: hypothetical protein AB7V18_07885 [Pyrinomonadaceae bacterium]